MGKGCTVECAIFTEGTKQLKNKSRSPWVSLSPTSHGVGLLEQEARDHRQRLSREGGFWIWLSASFILKARPAYGRSRTRRQLHLLRAPAPPPAARERGAAVVAGAVESRCRVASFQGWRQRRGLGSWRVSPGTWNSPV